MIRRIPVVVAAVLALLVSAGLATAAPPDDAATQAVGQSSSNEQSAGALSLASQVKPSNRTISVRVLSPGDGGEVVQSNSVDSDATAANANHTDQSADQAQSGSCGCDGGTQAVGQSSSNNQAAKALSFATQTKASNTNIPVRVLSPGDDGDVTQSNSVDSDATAANLNATEQDADQDQGGGAGTQAIGQENESEQDADAVSKAEQYGATNTNISVRVLSPGDDGDVRQSNSVDSDATAANSNHTKQDADQDQGGKHDECCDSGGTQAIGQESKSEQEAGALSVATQKGASNTNIPVRVLSPGDGGDVRQSNSVESDATALNLNATKQDADQEQGGGGKGGHDAKDDCCPSGGTQAIGQEAKNEQEAAALSAALQSGASNSNTPVRVGSKGDDGDVKQSNSVESNATAANLNATEQDADQEQGGGKGGHDGKDACCDAGGTQAIGQESKSEQGALAASLAVQAGGKDRCGCSSGGNSNAPVRVDSKGDDRGDVRQSNDVESDATALNLNATKQDADQEQGGGGKGGHDAKDDCCPSGGTQAIGQEAKNEQEAAALSAALQFGASNSNTPVRVGSKGDDGDVKQSNSVESNATAANLNATEQDADQEQGGGKGGHDGKDACCDAGGTQAIGQESKSEQGALAASLAVQAGGKDRCGCSSGGNSNAPVRVDSKGDDRGDVRQSNDVESDATALNLNATKQDADQEQGGSGTAVQAIGQSAKNEQEAAALSAALQFGASNSNQPVRVDSKGDGGDVEQSNEVDSNATAANLNATEQDADQEQGGGKDRCGCHDSIGVQAIGQEAKSEQEAAALSAALQFGASNSNEPVRVDSKGDDRGDVEQSNEVDSDATAANLNATKQDADQEQGSSGTAVQAIGQSAKNEQEALALSAALQFGADNSNQPVRVDSRGDGGKVEQSNEVDSDATALNLNATEQDADQEQGGGKECGCHGSTGIQAIGQEAKNDQDAFAGSVALQLGGHGKCGCSSGGNSNDPVRVGSKGDDGKAKQKNAVASRATSLNLNATKQKADQRQGKGGHGPGHKKGHKDRGGHCGAPSGHSAKSGADHSWWPSTTRRPHDC